MRASGCLWHGGGDSVGRLLQLPWLGVLQWSIFDHFCPRRAEARAEQPLPSKADKTQLP